MNILYGIQTTGHGHYIRARAMIAELRKRGHQVETLLSGPPLDGKWDLSIFEPYQIRQGFTFVAKNGRIDPIRSTLGVNAPKAYWDMYRYPSKHIDLVICDYEPISSRIAWLRNIPSIGIGHMYAFYHDIPVASSRFYHWVTRIMAPVRYPIGLHWNHYNKQPILPPTIPPEIVPGTVLKKDKILVYMGFENIDEIVAMLKPITSHRFHVYCKITERQERGNISLCPFSRDGFLKDLQECGGVIANAGFSLASEALHLGKKLLVRPVTTQFEQESNCIALLEGKLGSVMSTLDTQAVKTWLDFPNIEAMNYSNVIHPFLNWVEGGKWDNTTDLIEETWASSEHALSTESTSQNFGFRY